MLKRLLSPFLPVARFTATDRRITVTLWIAGLLQGFAQSQASATLPFTRVGLGLSEGEISLVLGLARLGGFAALPLAWWADRHGRRRPLLLGVTLIVIGGAAAGLAVDAWHFGAAQAVLRTGTAAISGLALVVLAESVSKPNRAFAISFYGAAVSLGSGLALMALPLADQGPESWRIPHLMIAAGFLLLPLLARRLPETAIYSEETRPGGRWHELTNGPWRTRFWTILLIAFLASTYGTFGTAFSTERLVNQVGLNTGTVVWILLLGGTAGGIGFFVGGHMADAWGRRSSSVLCLLLATIGGVTLYSVTTTPLIVAAVFVSSFGTFAWVPSGGSHRAELFPTTLRSAATTAAANAALLGSAFGLIVGVFTIDTLGLTTTLTLLAIGMVAAATLTLRLPETRGHDLTAISTDLP
jgi:MFS family permease